MLPELKIFENEPIGSLVGQFYQTKGDENVSTEYFLELDSSLDDKQFIVDLNGTLLTNVELDFEQNSEIPIKVSAFINGTEEKFEIL